MVDQLGFEPRLPEGKRGYSPPPVPIPTFDPEWRLTRQHYTHFMVWIDYRTPVPRIHLLKNSLAG